MKSSRRKMWAFAWNMYNGRCNIRPIAESDKKTLIKTMEGALNRPWAQIRRAGGVALECWIVPKNTKAEGLR